MEKKIRQGSRHENDPPKRVMAGSGEHSFLEMSVLVFPGLGAGRLN
jgi:hypothetical protein